MDKRDVWRSLPKAGNVARRAAQEALANVGVTEEGGNNRGKFVEIYQDATDNEPGSPWCMSFIVFRLLDAANDIGAKNLPPFPRTGYTPTFANWAKKSGLWIENTPSGTAYLNAGDLVFFYSKKLKRVYHVGIITEVFDEGVNTVEGNTSKPNGVDADGDGVYKKFRTWESIGELGGFVRLPF